MELKLSAIYREPSESNTTPQGRYSEALVASPLSPANLNEPLPATVEMIPVVATLRILAVVTFPV